MITCVKCNFQNFDSNKYCDVCGAELGAYKENVKTDAEKTKEEFAASIEKFLKKEGIIGGKLRKAVGQNLDPSEEIQKHYWIGGGVLLVLTDQNLWMFQVQSYGGNNIDPNFSRLWDGWTRSENNLAIPLQDLARFDPYPGYFQLLFTVTPEPFDLTRTGWEVKKDKESIEFIRKYVNNRGLKPAVATLTVVSESADDPKELLKKIKELFDDGLITEEEFVAKKADILKRL